jgi:hypothetical protein
MDLSRMFRISALKRPMVSLEVLLMLRTVMLFRAESVARDTIAVIPAITTSVVTTIRTARGRLTFALPREKGACILVFIPHDNRNVY